MQAPVATGLKTTARWLEGLVLGKGLDDNRKIA